MEKRATNETGGESQEQGPFLIHEAISPPLIIYRWEALRPSELPL